MNSKVFILACVIVLLAIAGGVFLMRNSKNDSNNTENIATPTSVIAVPTAEVGWTEGNANPSTAPEANIIVTEPKTNSTVRLPFTIKGSARVFENQFNYRILDASGKVLKEGSAYANSPDVGLFGDFNIEIATLPAAVSGSLTIEVFDYSAKDGSQQNTITVPVTLDTSK